MTKERPFYAEKGFIASGALLAVILLIGAAVALTGGSGHRETAASARHAAARHASASDSVCGLPGASQDPVVGPPVASWTLVGVMAAPTVPDVGPGVLDGHDRRCFAHSPVGAAVAAANTLALTTLPGNSLTKDQALGHVVPGHIRDVYARQPATPIDPGARFQIAGVRTEIIDRNTVTVTLALRTNIVAVDGGALGAIAISMRWWNGDWRFRPLSVEQPFTVDRIDSLEGFVKWSGA
jgi:hypothetical protein